MPNCGFSPQPPLDHSHSHHPSLFCAPISGFGQTAATCPPFFFPKTGTKISKRALGKLESQNSKSINRNLVAGLFGFPLPTFLFYFFFFLFFPLFFSPPSFSSSSNSFSIISVQLHNSQWKVCKTLEIKLHWSSIACSLEIPASLVDRESGVVYYFRFISSCVSVWRSKLLPPPLPLQPCNFKMTTWPFQQVKAHNSNNDSTTLTTDTHSP